MEQLEKALEALQRIEVRGENNLNLLLYAIQSIRKVQEEAINEITLSSGKTFDALWIGGPTIATGSVLMEIYDKRLISEIAKDFEGIEKITAEDKLADRLIPTKGFLH